MPPPNGREGIGGPIDPDGDLLFEDVNANGRIDDGALSVGDDVSGVVHRATYACTTQGAPGQAGLVFCQTFRFSCTLEEKAGDACPDLPTCPGSATVAARPVPGPRTASGSP